MTDRRGTGTFVTDTTELTTSHLDLYTAPIVENVLHSGATIEIHPTNAISNSGPYDFYLPRDADHYIQLPLTRLYGTLRIVKITDSSDLSTTDNVSVCNMFPHSLFKQIEIEVEGRQINDLSSSTYPIKAFMETILTYGKDAQETHLTAEGFYEDDPENADKFKENKGWEKRRNGIIGKDYNFSMKLHADFFQMERFLLPNTCLNIKFIRNSDTYSIMSETNIAKISIKNLRMSFHKIKISDEFNHAIQSNLSKEVSLYPITQGKIKSFLIQKGTTTTIFQNVLSGNLPQSLVIGFLHEKSFNGDVTHNPFLFQHFGLNNLNLKVNDTPFHPRPLQPDYETSNYLREYQFLFQNTGIHHGNMTNNISQVAFRNNYNFYPFDFSPELCNSAHHHARKSGHIDIELGFKTALNSSIYMILYSAHPQLLTIDEHRNVDLID
jgi:hypothetical protein